MAEIYRKVSLDRLSSPEQLDRMIRVTSPVAWLAYVGAVLIIVAALIWSILGRLPSTTDIGGVLLNPNKVIPIASPINGTIRSINVSEGDVVKTGDTILSIIGSNGIRGSITAESNGKITKLNFSVGDYVFQTDEIARMMLINEKRVLSEEDWDEEGFDEIEIICYVPASFGKSLGTGMNVLVTPTSVSEQNYGHMSGYIESISESIVNTSEMMAKLGNEVLVGYFQPLGPSLEVSIKLKEDKNTKSGYEWSNKNGSQVMITEGTMVMAKVIMKSEAPIVKLLPFLRNSSLFS